MIANPARVFRAEYFSNLRDWLHFAVEFDLQLCDGCHRTARRRPGTEAGLPQPWHCPECFPPFHPDLLRALRTRTDVATRCQLCHESVNISLCWISEDCQRLYCANHLQALRAQDRLRMAQCLLESDAPPGIDAHPVIRSHLNRLDRHLQSVDCSACSFNGRGIYDGDLLVEVDRSEHRCDSAPDAFHCGDIEAEPAVWS